MYNYYQQQQQMRTVPTYAPQPPTTLKGHPVASLDEVRATSIDFDGSIFYFPDIANKRIYTKAINLDGSAQVNMYELKPIPQEVNANTGDFITRQEFDKAISELTTNLNNTISQVTSQTQQPSNFKEVF